MKSLPVRRIYRLAVAALALAGALWSIVAVGFAAQAWWRLPDLSAWHRIALDSEFRAGNDGAAATFAAYLEQEARLFVELKQRIYDDPGQASRQPYDRYAAGSPVARLALESAGNRSGVTEAHAARGAVVLLHGLTDAPYSLHAVGRALHERGLHVVALRLPGHGTTPGALTRVSWHDWDAAVLLAVRHAAALAGGKPLYVAGYSTGAPLALLHALRAIDDPAVPMPTRLFLFSPAIGVSEFAVMSEFAGTLAFLPGLQKASWLDVLPEYDPFKYNSFPVNAANQVWRLTRELEARLSAAQEAGTLGRMPPITAFQSLVDSTVLAADVGRRLFMRLPARGHELVVFDVNRQEFLASLIAPGPRRAFEQVAQAPALPFRLAIVGNRSPASAEVVEWVREAGRRETEAVTLGLAWPRAVLSLGHIAVPMPHDDPLYGLAPEATGQAGAPSLGGPAPRGESGALVVPLGSLARVRSNPFFAVITRRLDEAVRLDLQACGPGCETPFAGQTQ
jgi:alpha-beta hydrolase superfamily lysophospholipase